MPRVAVAICVHYKRRLKSRFFVIQAQLGASLPQRCRSEAKSQFSFPTCPSSFLGRCQLTFWHGMPRPFFVLPATD
jgi:hypothetical protein